MFNMQGGLEVQGNLLARAGFMHAAIGPAGYELGPSLPILQRGTGLRPEQVEFIQNLQRTDLVGDVSQISHQLGATLAEIARGVSSGMTAFPVRENLESEAKQLVPLDTPVRNMLARRRGAGTASNWRQASSLGGGWLSTLDQPGSSAYIRNFFSETVTGSQAPAEHTTVYANRSAGYKLLGTFGSVTGFAMAAGG
jgi:hypothetical protein